MEIAQHHTLDATGKPVGRIASQIVGLLRGKHKPSFDPSVENMDTVEVTNASHMIFTGKKLQQKTYLRHSGYLGSLKSRTAGDLMKTQPDWVLFTAVEHMMPKNRLRPKMLKRLTIKP